MVRSVEISKDSEKSLGLIRDLKTSTKTKT
jgi:hypothetical protein